MPSNFGTMQKKRASRLTSTRCPLYLYFIELKLADVLSQRSSVALFYIKAHPDTFSEALESEHIDRGVVKKAYKKNYTKTILRLYLSLITIRKIAPFIFSSHLISLSVKTLNKHLLPRHRKVRLYSL